MLTRKTRIQLIAFFLIAIVSVSYAAYRFTDVGKLIGADGYTARLQLASSGGIFSNAEVTYRGVNVGRVGELRLTANGMEADLNIEPDMPKIPADLQAVVANRSAVGEQYVDLRPKRDSGPYLENGSVIDERRAKTPVGTDQVISDLNSLASSVPIDSLRTVVDESYEAFRGTGPDLQVLMDNARDFTRSARANLPQTVQLLNTGGTVLDTQNAEASNIKSFSRDLRLLAGQLKNSDGDLRKLISTTPQVSRQVSGLLRESGSGLSVVLANLLTTSKILATRNDGLEMSFIVYPMAGVAANSLIDEEGKAHLGFALNLLDPPTCVKGYEGTQRRLGSDTRPVPPNYQAHCGEPKGSPINVRGSQNVPYGSVPTSPTPAQIQANEDRPTEAQAEQRGAPGTAGSGGVTLTSMGQLLGLPN
ncbi:MAG: MCE family protein [Pseudonocardiaceae bacterium]|nr:MCE family protein [Pseudonocardiaceae bacterium]